MSRQLKELRSLMPWTWDARLEQHPPGKSSMRDFKDTNTWNEPGHRRAAKLRPASTLPPKKRPRQIVPLTPRCNTEPKVPFAPHSANSSAWSSGGMCAVDTVNTPAAAVITPASQTKGQHRARSMARLQGPEELTASPDSQLDTVTPSVRHSKEVLSSVDESYENMPPCATGRTNTSTAVSRVGRCALDVTLVHTACGDSVVKPFEAKLAEVEDTPGWAANKTIPFGALSPVRLRQITEQQPGAASPTVIDIAPSPGRVAGPEQKVVHSSPKGPEDDGSKAFDDALNFLSAEKSQHDDRLLSPSAVRPIFRPIRRASLISSMKPKHHASYVYTSWDDYPVSPLSQTEDRTPDDCSHHRTNGDAASIFGSIIPRPVLDKNDEIATDAADPASDIASIRAQTSSIISHKAKSSSRAHLSSLPPRLRFKQANKRPVQTSNSQLPILPLNTTFKLPNEKLPPRERYMRAYRLQAYPWSDQPEYASAENISNLKWTAEGEAGMQRGCTLIRWLDAAEEKRAKLKRARKFEAVHQCQAPKASD